MNRFATDPRRLIHLPPTMAPVATSDRTDYLEHPDQAFDYFRNTGISKVICEEKHMGSRAVLIFAKDTATANRQFGITNNAAGVIVTRTGRPFFNDQAISKDTSKDIRKDILARVRSAATAARWWNTLETDWLVLDTELLPWSAKAKELLQRQYAATGTAATTALATAKQLLGAAAARCVDVGTLAQRTEDRRHDVASYINAYRQLGSYSARPVSGLGED